MTDQKRFAGISGGRFSSKDFEGLGIWSIRRGRLYYDGSARPMKSIPAREPQTVCANLVHQLIAARSMLPPGYDPKKDELILIVKEEKPVCSVRPAPQKAKAFVVRRYVVKGK